MKLKELKLKKSFFILIFLIALWMSSPVTPVFAGEETLVNSLLELLIQKGIIDRTEADKLLETAKGKDIKEKDIEDMSAEAPPIPEGELEFDFASPDLAPPPSSPETGLAGGVFSDLNFGGTFDSRWRIRESGDIPGEVVHINELVLTTNIGEHITFLGEWLLQTSDFVNNVGDDHGFAYAMFSDIPYLPKNSSVKIGRFRVKYGIDAVLDAPLNPLYTQLKKNLGFASDLGIEFEGYADLLDLEYSVALMNGPDNLRTQVMNADGSPGAYIRTSKANNSLPVVIHLSREFERLQGLRLGLSYFDGRTWTYRNGLSAAVNAREPVGINGGAVDGTEFVYKRRGSVDFSYRSETFRANLSGEFTLGKDWLSDDTATVKGYYFRVDRPLLPHKLDLQVQLDYWDDGISSTNDGYNAGLGLKYKLTDVAFFRATYSFNNRYDDDYVFQVYLPF